MLYRSKHAEYCEYQILSLYFVFQPALSSFTAYHARQWNVGGWAEAQSNCNIRIKQHEWHAASVWLRWVKRATRWLSSFLFTGLMCPVRQSQSRHFVSGCHIKLCSARSVTGDCLCVRVCVCKATLGLFPVFFECCVLLQRKAGLTELRLSAYLPFAGGPPQPFSPSASDLHTHTHTKNHATHAQTRVCVCAMWTRSHCHRRRQSQQLIFMHLNPYPCGPWFWVASVFVSELRGVWACVCLFRRVISLGTVDSAGVVTETKLEIHGFRIQ